MQDRSMFISKELRKTSKELAEVVAAALSVKNATRARELIDTFIKEFFILGDNIDCMRLILMNELWYLCLRRLYETSEYINVYGFLVEADVSPSSSYTYSIDLTQTNVCCVCPKFTCASDLGGYVKLTNLVNEEPVDFKVRRWVNKYAARNRPMPDSIADSLLYGYDYVIFPKRKVKVTFNNTHSTETAHCIFYADYMDNIYNILVSKLLDIMFKKPEEVIRV